MQASINEKSVATDRTNVSQGIYIAECKKKTKQLTHWKCYTNERVPQNIKRDFYSDAYTILSQDLINSMNHMRIPVTEPSSVILS